MPLEEKALAAAATAAAARTAQKAEVAAALDLVETDKMRALVAAGDWITAMGADPDAANIRMTSHKNMRGRENGWFGASHGGQRAIVTLTWTVDEHQFAGYAYFRQRGDGKTYYHGGNQVLTFVVCVEVVVDVRGKRELQKANTLEELGTVLAAERRYLPRRSANSVMPPQMPTTQEPRSPKVGHAPRSRSIRLARRRSSASHQTLPVRRPESLTRPFPTNMSPAVH